MALKPRCPVCGALLDELGKCTKCSYVDPSGINRTGVRRCPVCGASVAYGKCTRCQWKEGQE